MAQYRILVASRVKAQLLRHTGFLARVSVPAARRFRDAYAEILKQLEANPRQFPIDTDLNLPEGLYRFRILAPLGFPDPAFRSSDYFPLLPWLFLFFTGFHLYRIVEKSAALQRAARVKIPLLSALGRHTLWVYLLHQPLLMGLCMILL